jgi:hypothetical protein
LSGHKCGHGVNGIYLPGNNLLRAQVLREITEKLLDLYPLSKLVFNSRLGFLCIIIVRRVQVSVQLSLYHYIIDLIEVIFLVCVVHLSLKTLPCIFELIVKLFIRILF